MLDLNYNTLKEDLLEDEFFNIIYDEELYNMLEEIAKKDSDRAFDQRYASWF